MGAQAVRNAAGLAALVAVSGMTGPGFAFDCRKAQTVSEKAICASPDALAANAEMEKAYFALRDRLDEAGRTILAEGQRTWLAYRDNQCEGNPDCLSGESTSRLETLVSTKEPFVPFFLYRAPRDGDYRVSISGIRFPEIADRGSAGFNAAIDAAIARTPYYGDNLDVEADRTYEHDLTIAVSGVGPRLISAVAYSYDYSGGAHPNSWTHAINIDRASGAELSADALFAPGREAGLVEECARQIVAWYDAEDGLSEAEAVAQLEETYPGAVREHVRDLTRWRFAPDGATVQFDSYAVASYAAGPAECVFAYDQLEGLVYDAEIFAGLK